MTDYNRQRLVLYKTVENGCEQVSYGCLLSFYNQHDHELLDCTLVLPWLQGLKSLTLATGGQEKCFAELLARCESDLECEMLVASRDRGLPLPGAAQHPLYEGDAPLTVAGFCHESRNVVFVDAVLHYCDYVQAAYWR